MDLTDLTYRTSASTRRAFNRVDTSSATAAVTGLAEWPSFVRDAFGRVFAPGDAAAAPIADEQVPPWAAKAAREIEAMPTMPELRSACAGSRVLAAEATTTITAALAQHLGLDRLPDDDAAEAEADVEAEVRALCAAAEASGDEVDVEAAKAAGRRWAKAKARRAVIADRMSDAVAMVGDVVAAATEVAAEKAEAVRALRGTLAGTDMLGPDGDVDDDLVRMISGDRNLVDVLRALGRLQAARRGAMTEVPGAGNLDVVGIDFGDDASTLVDDELSMFLLGAEDDVMARLVEKRAMTWQRRREDAADLGPFALLLDTSGSMWGDNIVTARAVAAAMLLDAVKAKRRVTVIAYHHEVRGHVIVEAGKVDTLKAALRLLATPPAGGTRTEGALLVATSLLPNDDRRKADAVVVSDGEWGTDRGDTLKAGCALRRNGGRFVEVRVGCTDSAAVLAEHPWMDAAVAIDDTGGAVRALAMVGKAHRR